MACIFFSFFFFFTNDRLFSFLFLFSGFFLEGGGGDSWFVVNMTIY